jgi:hypothetical protein
MSAAEIRADIAAAYESAARGYEQLAVGRLDIAVRCREQAETLREHAARVEAQNVQPLQEAA